ncbi:unnamed protein product [Adineta steineri]|uniref:Uncharacterized protein n=1 Tax=Adineta steineri TaxID=433720 RepID=A0A819G328_9BILA|nr:unnamed protein product [Adineta steineri]CAF0808051.1 unnamed protein product [Adineta steineri]CAF3876526.1 unnamed protein product [Adineta steineri]CAF3915100.1 unnamed protein product [Adineta steineri]
MNYSPGSIYGYQAQSSSYNHVSSFNKVEKTTHSNSNSNQLIDGQSNHPPQYLPHNGPSFPSGSVVYSTLMQPPNLPQLGSNDLINDLERSTNMDINSDGLIGGQRSQLPPHNGPSLPPGFTVYNGPTLPAGFTVYNAPMHPPSFPQVGSDDLERSKNTDYNGDGSIGEQFMQPPPIPNYQPYNNPIEPPVINFSAGEGLINQVEKRTHKHCHGNGHINRSHPHCHHSGGDGAMNEREKSTHVECHGNRHIGRPPSHTPNFQPHNDSSPHSHCHHSHHHHSRCHHSGGKGVMNEREKSTHIEYNGGRRIGGSSSHFSNYQSNNGFNNHQPGSDGLIKELEKITHIDLNGDGRIG